MSSVAPFVGAWIEIWWFRRLPRPAQVAPFVGAWIEIGMTKSHARLTTSLRSSERGLKYLISNVELLDVRRSVRRSVDWNDKTACESMSHDVAPFVGAWIEIIRTEEIIHTIKSLRSSERGLKCSWNWIQLQTFDVAPFVGAWIEIGNYTVCKTTENVAPFVGAWIEIGSNGISHISNESLRSSERGLKSF